MTPIVTEILDQRQPVSLVSFLDQDSITSCDVVYCTRFDNVKLDPLDFLEETDNMDLRGLQVAMVCLEEMACLAYMVPSEKKVK